jgi:hypothetical protein
LNEERKQMMSYEFRCWSHQLRAEIIEHMNNAKKEIPDIPAVNLLTDTFEPLKP